MEEILALKEELASLKKENERLKAFSVLPEDRPLMEPSDFQPDPLIEKFKTQLHHLQDANLIFQKVMEVNQQVELALSTLIPALELQLHGMDNEMNQLRQGNVDLENTYVDVVAKLEGQIKELRTMMQSQEDQFLGQMKHMEARQQQLATELEAVRTDAQKYQQELQQIESRQIEAEKAEPEKPEADLNPFTALNIFDL